MNEIGKQFGVPQNLGWLDRCMRVLVGAALIGVCMYVFEAGVTWPAYLALVAVYPLLTGMIGYDPLYEIFAVRSCGVSERNQCGTFPFEIDAALGHHPMPTSDIEHSLEHSRHMPRKS
jgi:hypothetical protein